MGRGGRRRPDAQSASTLNERLSTPNKLFEALAAGLPVVSRTFRRCAGSSSTTPMARWVPSAIRRYVALADAIRSILDLEPTAGRTCVPAVFEPHTRGGTGRRNSARLVALYETWLRGAAHHEHRSRPPARHPGAAVDGRVRLQDIPDRRIARGARPRGDGAGTSGPRALRPPKSHPAGYRIVRVPVDAIDGLPLPAALRRALRRARRGGQAPAPRSGDGPARDSMAPVRAAPRVVRLASRARQLVAGIWRIAAIALVVRSQERASRAVDAGSDIYHGMAYMGVPVALGLAGRHPGVPPIYDARDVYVDARNLARLPGPVRQVVARVERGWARRVDQVVTVNEPYAEVMAQRWSIGMPLVVMNCSYRFSPPSPRERRFHERLGLDPAARVILYQGGFSPERGIEQLLEAIVGIDRGGAGPHGLRSAQGGPAGPGELDRSFAAVPTSSMRCRPPSFSAGLPALMSSPSRSSRPPSTTGSRRPTSSSRLSPRGSRSSRATCPAWPASCGSRACGLVCDPTDPAAIAAAIRGILDLPAAERRRVRTGRSPRRTIGTTGRRRWSGCSRPTQRLTGRPW